MKINIKFLFIGLLSFITGVISVSAKQYTINELGNSLDPSVNYAYVIGNYVFAKKNLTTSEIMAASRSIDIGDVDPNNYDEVLKKMYVSYISREIDFETLEPTGNWIVEDNLFGDYELPTKVEVNHVDGKIVKEKSEFSVDLENGKYQNELKKLYFSGNNEFSEKLKITDNKLSGLVLKKNLEGDTFTGDDKTGYYFAFVLNIPKANDKTTVSITGKRNYKFTKSNFDSDTEVVVLWALSKDLQNKTITITVDVDGDGQLYEPNTYILDYSELVFQEDSELEISATDGESYQLADLNLTGSVYQNVDDKKYYVNLKLAANKAVKGKATVNVDGTSETMNSGDFSSYNLKYELKKDTCQSENCKFDVTIDYDGSENKYLPKTYTITYPDINYIESYTVNFNYGNKQEKQNVYADAKIQKPEDPTANEYHKFLGWALSDNQRENIVFENYEVKSDVTFVPHWELINIDEYISSKIEENNKIEKLHEKINFIKKDTTIEADILSPDLPTSAINETIIPETIYELLSKNEITQLDMKIGEASVSVASDNVTLESVKSEIKNLLADDSLANATLDDMVSKGEDLTISIASVADNIERLSNSYTIDFVSDFRIVSDLDDLKNALSSVDVDMIYINDDITVENIDGNSVSFTIDTERNVTLKSLDSEDIKTISLIDKKLEDTFDPDKEPVIIIKNGNITIEDLMIKGGSTAIKIGNEASSANVTLSNVTAVDSINSAFDVNSGSVLNIPNIENIDYKKTVNGELKDKESYHNPIICGKGKVVSSNITKIDNYKRIVTQNGGTWSDNDFRNPEDPENKYYNEFLDEETGELDQEYKDLIDSSTKNHVDYVVQTDHTHYYKNDENSKYYTFYFWDGRIRLLIMKYFAKGDEIVPPMDYSYNILDGKNSIFYFKKVRQVDGKTYVHDGWTKNSDSINGEKISNFEFPTSSDKIQVYYRHFSEGYMVEIPVNVNGEQKDGVFGILKKSNEESVTIQNLINSDSEFANAWNQLKKRAQEEDSKDIYDLSGKISGVVDENSVIDGDIKLDVIEPTKANIALASDSEDYNLSNNSLSGDLYANKFAINVNIPNVEANKSTITVTNPNNEVNTIKATSENTQIELAAITSSMLNNNANKVYKIAVDADGEESNFGPMVYLLDYENLTLSEEIINYAAEKTQNAVSLTVENRGHFKNRDVLYDKKYQKGEINSSLYLEYKNTDKDLKYIVYSFNPDHHRYYTVNELNDLYKQHKSSDASTVSVQKDVENENRNDSVVYQKDDHYYLNGYKYVGTGYHGLGVSEVALLRDVISDSKIEALDTVKLVKKEKDYNEYEVTISKKRMNAWLDSNYDAYNNAGTDSSEGEKDAINTSIKVTVYVSNDGYITKIYTESGNEFTYRRVSDDFTYIKNRFDITIKDIENTEVPDVYTQLQVKDQTDEAGNVKTKEEIVKEYLKSAGHNRNLEQ